jgi:hypothetical protein
MTMLLFSKGKPKTFNPIMVKRKFIDNRKIKEGNRAKNGERKCVVCHIEQNLRVHHMSYKHHGFEHKYLEDLTTVCNCCHKIIHGII